MFHYVVRNSDIFYLTEGNFKLLFVSWKKSHTFSVELVLPDYYCQIVSKLYYLFSKSQFVKVSLSYNRPIDWWFSLKVESREGSYQLVEK